MKFGSAHSPTTPLSPTVISFVWLLTAVVIVMATTQLITYEKFVPLIQDYQLLQDPAFGKVFAALIVLSEVMAVPFLLRMSISPLLRVVSAGSLMLMGGAWLVLGVWHMTATSAATSAGIFGSLLQHGLHADITVIYGAILVLAGVMAVWLLRRDFTI